MTDRKRILAPSILSADFSHLARDMEETVRAGVSWSHIDVMDGRFVPSISLGLPVIESIRRTSTLFFDVHLMIEDPGRYIEAFAKAGADLITFHIEAADLPSSTFSSLACIEKIRTLNKKVGISIKPGTAPKVLSPFLQEVDLVLLMTVEPGFGGQSYLDFSTERIREVRQMLDRAGSRAYLEVDGGIKLENMDVVIGAGADVIVAGSAIYGGNIYEKTRQFLDRLQ